MGLWLMAIFGRWLTKSLHGSVASSVCECVLLLYSSTDTKTPQKHPLNNLDLHKKEEGRDETQMRFRGSFLGDILHPSVFPGDLFHPAVVHYLSCLLGTMFCVAYHQVIVFN